LEQPIQYSAVLRFTDGKEVLQDLEEKGWLAKHELSCLQTFTLISKSAESGLPVVSVDLSPVAEGTEKRLVYFSRVLGKIATDESGEALVPLVRLYCVGWQATIGGVNVKSLAWVYPTGAVVVAEEPLWADELLELAWAEHQAKVS